MNAPIEISSAPADHKPMADKLAALAHPVRIEILRHLAVRDACCCKDVVNRINLAQSTVSQHLKVLVAAGLVRLTPEKQRSRYEVDREAVAELAGSIGQLLESCCAAPSGMRSE